MNPPRLSHPIEVVTALLLAVATPSQASFTTFGTACLGGQAISAPALPRIGHTLPVAYAGVFGNSFFGLNSQLASPFLLLGLSNTQAGATPLPFVLPMTVTGGLSNCQVLVSPDVTAMLPLSAQYPYTLPIALPANQALVGFTMHLQWFTVVERSYMGVPTSVYLVTSNAATAVIGN